MHYVNDGVYGSFNYILYDHAHVKAMLQKRPKPDEKYYSSSIWGPTSDGLDQIVERCNLPEMHVGGWMLFEDMGITYLGPVDGHDISSMVSVINDAKRVEGPVMIHVLTQKGRGYRPAERHPARFHGAEPF